MRLTLVGIGANLDRRLARFRFSWQLLDLLLEGARRSSIWTSLPAGFADQPKFWNAVVAGRTTEEPDRLLGRLKEIERAAGRIPRFPNGPRELDLDLLFVEGEERQSPFLTLPHPAFEARPFVILPASEVEPRLSLRAGSPPLAELAAACSAEGLERLCPPGEWEKAGVGGARGEQC
jgi:2-amino-4-hydroxy-6-hydroxymethyldihydropteridine diphosphokinase